MIRPARMAWCWGQRKRRTSVRGAFSRDISRTTPVLRYRHSAVRTGGVATTNQYFVQISTHPCRAIVPLCGLRASVLVHPLIRLRWLLGTPKPATMPQHPWLSMPGGNQYLCVGRQRATLSHQGRAAQEGRDTTDLEFSQAFRRPANSPAVVRKILIAVGVTLAFTPGRPVRPGATEPSARGVVRQCQSSSDS